MKKTMVVLAHPNFEESISNKILIDKIKDIDNLYINNLYSRYPDNIFDIQTEQKLLISCERVIFQFPLYWYSCPAILKKWLEDVLTPGFAYGRNGSELGTKLIGKQFGVITTIGGVENMYTPGGIVSSSINDVLKHLQTTIEYIGGVYIYPLYLYGCAFVKDESHFKKGIEKYLEYIHSEYIAKDKQYERLVKLAYENQAKGYY